MKKIVQIICFAVIVCCFVTISAVAAGNYLLPDSFSAANLESAGGGKIFSVSGVRQAAGASREQIEGELRLLSAVPVKDVRVASIKRNKVAVCGSVFALRMFTQGVNVVDLDAVATAEGEKRPALDAGFMRGDVITAVNGDAAVSAEAIGRYVADCAGSPVLFTVSRAGSVLQLSLTPAIEQGTGLYKAGLWLRDSAAGIGTMTFYDPESGVYAGLGHCVSDADTGLPVQLRQGDILTASITGIRKGGGGQAGELTGAFVSADVIGDIRLNSDKGIYGVLTDAPDALGEYEIAEPEEIETGEAQIAASIDNDGPRLYSARIEKIRTGADERNMVIRVTDSRLLAACGGIVQGMSGSPILQNGRLIGAVTHVLLDDSATGYAIFAKTMYEQAGGVGNETRNAA